jgi:holo-[acyl-carrier protein] synthase
MILGIGIDLAATDRLAAFRARWQEKGLRRLFTAGELEYCARLARPEQSLTARFAAKEAFFKALGTGYGIGGSWLDVEVVRGRRGRPRLRLRGRAALLARRRGVRRIHLSLSHTLEHAIAQVLLER